MKSRLHVLLIICCIPFFLAQKCEKKDSGTVSQTLMEHLLVEYENGEISRCEYLGETVYKCSRNAPDGGAEIIDARGNTLGGCYYNTNTVHEACENLENCTVLYRVDPNIWGKPGVEFKDEE